MKTTLLDSNQILDDIALKKSSHPSLERMEAMDRAFGFPSKCFRSVHVAGTNGKGSVTTKIAKGLTCCGHKTGLYTSPHINTFRERIKVDGQMISVGAVDEYLNQIFLFSVEVTFFEVMTMLAFLHFRKEKVGFAVIETGLGGKYDATNIIQPNLTVITNISFDHTQILGNTLEEIAENKAGIIKSETPVVLGNRAALRPMFRAAFKLRSPLHIVRPVFDWMEENEAIAKRALTVLSIPHAAKIPDVPPCRFEIIEREGVTYLFDIAHNPDGMEKLFDKLKRTFPERSYSVIFSMSAGKEVSTAVRTIERYTCSIFPFDSGTPRLLRKPQLEEILGRGVDESLEVFLAKAKERGDVIVVTGSAYIMKELKTILLLDV